MTGIAALVFVLACLLYAFNTMIGKRFDALESQLEELKELVAGQASRHTLN